MKKLLIFITVLSCILGSSVIYLVESTNKAYTNPTYKDLCISINKEYKYVTKKMWDDYNDKLDPIKDVMIESVELTESGKDYKINYRYTKKDLENFTEKLIEGHNFETIEDVIRFSNTFERIDSDTIDLKRVVENHQVTEYEKFIIQSLLLNELNIKNIFQIRDDLIYLIALNEDGKECVIDVVDRK